MVKSEQFIFDPISWISISHLYISFGIILLETLIIKRVKYRVIPIGIKTTIPAMKLLRNLLKTDFLTFFWVILFYPI